MQTQPGGIMSIKVKESFTILFSLCFIHRELIGFCTTDMRWSHGNRYTAGQIDLFSISLLLNKTSQIAKLPKGNKNQDLCCILSSVKGWRCTEENGVRLLLTKLPGYTFPIIFSPPSLQQACVDLLQLLNMSAALSFYVFWLDSCFSFSIIHKCADKLKYWEDIKNRW